MFHLPSRRGRRFLLASIWVVVGFVAGVRGGEVRFDGSFGRRGALPGPDFRIPAEAGKQAGGNLFHSFQRFDLSRGEAATFQGPANVANILARVTGGTASSLDGTLRSEISGANVYFINPSGVIFGPNATLEVSGSFTATTADYVKLTDGARLEARLGADDALLTSAPVSAFGFLSPAPAPVSFIGSQLATADGQDFTIIAGDLTLDAAALAAPAGRLSLISAAAAGEVPAAPSALAGFPAAVLPAMGAVVLKNRASANIDGAGGGHIVIRGGKLQLTGGSFVSSQNNGAARGGPVSVRATNSVAIEGAQLRANTFGPARGGDLEVEAPVLTVEGPAVGSGLFAAVAPGAAGSGGDILVRSDALTLTRGAGISTDSFGLGNGGNIDIAAPSLTIDGENLVTGIFGGINSAANARGGNLTIRSDDLALTAGANISTTIFGQGDGGDVRISAKKLRIDRRGADFETGIFAGLAFGASGRGGNIAVESEDLALTGGGVISANTGGRGPGGSVNVSAAKLVLASGGNISASTLGPGDGGSIEVSAGTIDIDRQGTTLPTGIFDNVEAGAVGRGGDIVVRSHALTLRGGGEISAGLSGEGAGGSVRIISDTLRLDGRGSDFRTSIVATVEASGVGRGGDLIIRSGGLSLIHGGTIAANTFGQGDGGSISIRADHVHIDARSSGRGTGVFAAVASGAIGRGGDVRVHSERLSLFAGGAIVADSFGRGDGGSIAVFAPTLRIDARGANATTGIVSDLGSGAVGRGGDVFVQSRDLSIARGGQISANTFGRGHGGNVDVSADRLRLVGRGSRENNGIFAAVLPDARGKGGDISVRSDDLAILGGSFISADTAGRGDGGTVRIAATKFRVDSQGLDFLTGLSSDVSPGGIGRGGDIIVRSDELSLLGGGVISTDTFGSGDSGTIDVSAVRLLIDGQNLDNFTGISSDVIDNLRGNGGDVIVRSNDLTIRGGGYISVDAAGRGNGGNVQVAARTLRIDGGAFDIFTGISSDVLAGAVGNGGDVLVRSGVLTLTGGGVISAATAGRGDGGDLQIFATTLHSVGAGSGIFGVVSQSGIGRGGSITIEADKLALRAGSTISADTFGRGDGGTVNVIAANLQIENPGSGITSAVAASALGDGGDIFVHGDTLTMSDSGVIFAATLGRGDAGSVRLEVGDLLIDAARGSFATGIFASAEAGSTGRGGSVEIAGDTLTIRGKADPLGTGGITVQSNTGAPAGSVTLRLRKLAMSSSSLITSANTATGNAGSIEIAARDALTMEGGSVITVFSQAADAGAISISAGSGLELHGDSRVIASAGANGGSISVNAGDFFFLDRSTIAATAGTTLAASGAGGAGGNIAVTSNITVLNDGTISANAALGRGGNILLRADHFFRSESLLTATGATAGTVEIAAPELDLSAGLVVLPGALLDASTQLREQCARRLGLDFSSFLVIGRGGVSLAPDEPLTSGSTQARRKGRGDL